MDSKGNTVSMDGRSPRVGVKALIVHEGRLLLNHIVTPDGHSLYGPPGGGQEHGETQIQALIRECREEIGALVEVHQVACVYEVMTDRRFRDGAAIPPFHQVNVAFWCGLAPGEEPGEPTSPDAGQVGCVWLPMEQLDRYDVRPAELVQWLGSDPSAREVRIGVTGEQRRRSAADAVTPPAAP